MTTNHETHRLSALATALLDTVSEKTKGRLEPRHIGRVVTACEDLIGTPNGALRGERYHIHRALTTAGSQALDLQLREDLVGEAWEVLEKQRGDLIERILRLLCLDEIDDEELAGGLTQSDPDGFSTTLTFPHPPDVDS